MIYIVIGASIFTVSMFVRNSIKEAERQERCLKSFDEKTK
jgi:hypothetical protein